MGEAAYAHQESMFVQQPRQSNLVVFPSAKGMKASYAGRQIKGEGTKTVQSLESYSQVKELLNYLLAKKRYRDYALAMTGFATGLRISDLVALKVGDIVSLNDRSFKNKIDIREIKTGKRTVSDVDEVSITEAVRESIKIYLDKLNWRVSEEDALFRSRESSNNNYHLSESQGWRIIKNSIEDCGIGIKAGSHTLRKTFLNIANAVGCSSTTIQNNSMVLTDVMVLARHSKLSTTLRYTTLMKSRLLSLRKGVSAFLLGKTSIKELKMEYVWEEGDE